MQSELRRNNKYHHFEGGIYVLCYFYYEQQAIPSLSIKEGMNAYNFIFLDFKTTEVIFAEMQARFQIPVKHLLYFQ